MDYFTRKKFEVRKGQFGTVFRFKSEDYGEIAFKHFDINVNENNKDSIIGQFKKEFEGFLNYHIF